MRRRKSSGLGGMETPLCHSFTSDDLFGRNEKLPRKCPQAVQKAVLSLEGIRTSLILQPSLPCPGDVALEAAAVLCALRALLTWGKAEGHPSGTGGSQHTWNVAMPRNQLGQ